MSINANTSSISVVVCTLNRSQLLRSCLESLADQHISDAQFEVIVINNGSTDDTYAVINEFTNAYKHFRSFKEDCLGLSHARNRGWKEAFGEYVAYIDDDAVAPSDWVAQIKAFSERCPQVLVFGGPYESFSMVPVPVWFPPDYGNWSLGGNERPITVGEEWINGTNMIFKKELLSRFGGFNTTLGMSGSRISYGEETRLLLDLKEHNIAVYYAPAIKVRHLIADYKMRLSWLLSSSYAMGKCSAVTFDEHQCFLSHVSNIALSIIFGIGNFFCCSSEPLKRRIYVSFSTLFFKSGSFVEYFSTRKRL